MHSRNPPLLLLYSLHCSFTNIVVTRSHREDQVSVVLRTLQLQIQITVLVPKPLQFNSETRIKTGKSTSKQDGISL